VFGFGRIIDTARQDIRPTALGCPAWIYAM
jgi:hypothetical protein